MDFWWILPDFQKDTKNQFKLKKFKFYLNFIQIDFKLIFYPFFPIKIDSIPTPEEVLWKK